MNYLVTGAAGFIGSHLVEKLLSDGHLVVGFDDLSDGLESNLPKHKNFYFCKLDICDIDQLKPNVFPDNKMAGVFHLAAKARIQPSISAPKETINTNLNGTLNILQAMLKWGCKNIVFSSSSSIYGNQNKQPLTEDMQARCLTPYSISKYSAEQLCKVYTQIHGFQTVSLRYFNVFGPRSPVHIGGYSPVVSLFFKQALKDKHPLTLVGDGFQKRDFTFIDDVVEANIAAMNNLQDSASASGEVINIGTGKSISMVELAEKVKATLVDINKDITTVSIPARPGEARETLADISKAKNLLDWQPAITMDDALQQLKNHYLTNVFV